MTAAPTESWTVTNYYKQAVYDPKESKIGDIDDVLVDILVEEPIDRVEDLRLADAPTATAQQKLENPPLPARERKRLAVYLGLAHVEVDAQFADRHVTLFAEHAPVDRADAGDNLTYMDRLTQNVVGAALFGGQPATGRLSNRSWIAPLSLADGL